MVRVYFDELGWRCHVHNGTKGSRPPYHPGCVGPHAYPRLLDDNVEEDLTPPAPGPSSGA